MLTLFIALGAIMLQMFLLIGGVIGYLIYSHLVVTSSNAIIPDHPEFFDKDGNMISEELITIRFEGSYDQFEEWGDDE